MAARQYTNPDSLSDARRWAAIGLGAAAAALALTQLRRAHGRGGFGANASPPVSKAFTINRPPDEVAHLWNELDPFGDIVEHVRFDLAPGSRGTEVRVQFQPAWFGRRSPARVQEQLRQFKQLVETGEIARAGCNGAVTSFGDTPEGGRVEQLFVGGAR
ncbi:MAG TPA: hypothetical protein VGI12_01145 [Vicinamibacterales bacterium]|jgi:uncharacterized membrane protein